MTAIGREPHGEPGSARERHGSEQDVPDDAAVLFRHQGNQRRCPGAQRFHQPRLVRPPEGGSIHRVHRAGVAALLGEGVN